MKTKAFTRCTRLLVVPTFALLLVGLLFVASSHHQQVYAQAGAPVQAPAAPDAIDCNNPLPGQWARLIGDDEIVVAYRQSDDPRWLHTATINDVNGVLQTAVTHERKDTDSELYEDSWLSATGSDLDGNRKDELVAAYKNHDSDVAATADPFDGVIYTDYPDWSDTDTRNNGNIMDTDVAAGNLDPTDAGDEIAMVYRDDYADLHIKVLDGSNAGYIKNADDTETADFVWDQNSANTERGEIRHSAVAVGDMNGDGIDEMAVAFKDSSRDLQVMVVGYKPGNNVNITPLYEYDSWSARPQYDSIANDCSSYSNKRPLDIAMGDLDGDNQDEIVVGFRGASCNYGKIELMGFDYQPTNSTSTKYDVTFTNFLEFDPEPANSYQYQAANNVALAVADVDGDGVDEIAMAWNLIANAEHEDRDLYHYVTTFDYFAKLSPDWYTNCDHTGPSCLKQRPGSWNAGRHDEPTTYNEANHESWAAVAAGDLDKDGMDEVILGSYNANNASLELFPFNAETGISSPYSKQVISGNFWEMAIAAGDADGDSRWGQYYNKQCRARHDVVVNGVVHAPPFWPEGAFEAYSNTYRTAASYGMEIGAGGGNGTSTENSVGASVEIPRRSGHQKARQHQGFLRERMGAVNLKRDGVHDDYGDGHRDGNKAAPQCRRRGANVRGGGHRRDDQVVLRLLGSGTGRRDGLRAAAGRSCL